MPEPIKKCVHDIAWSWCHICFDVTGELKTDPRDLLVADLKAEVELLKTAQAFSEACYKDCIEALRNHTPPKIRTVEAERDNLKSLIEEARKALEIVKKWSDTAPAIMGDSYRLRKLMFAATDAALSLIDSHTEAGERKPEGSSICSDCPPKNYPTNKTRCMECPYGVARAGVPEGDAGESAASDSAVILLTKADQAQLLESLLNPPEPNAALRRAFSRNSSTSKPTEAKQNESAK